MKQEVIAENAVAPLVAEFLKFLKDVSFVSADASN